MLEIFIISTNKNKRNIDQDKDMNRKQNIKVVGLRRCTFTIVFCFFAFKIKNIITKYGFSCMLFGQAQPARAY